MNLLRSRLGPLFAALLLGQIACGGPSLIAQCQTSCRHIYGDCFTGKLCQDCAKSPESTVDEAACEADCETRPNICQDAGALYACLSEASCDRPSQEVLTPCYSAGECVSLDGGGDRPTVSIANWGGAGWARSAGGTVEIDWVSAAGKSPFCSNSDGTPTPVADLSILGAGVSPVMVPADYSVAAADGGCFGECFECPSDGGTCTAILLADGEYWQTASAAGTINIWEVSPLHVVGSFSATQSLPDGGSAVLEGTFDAPRGCLNVPDIPQCSFLCTANCSTAGTQIEAVWGIGLLVLWRRRRARRIE